ncbi:hypothetical protein KIL84_007171 [Mauremys mutica]|uniref:Uncharacterized protein n=1 Tax=Mauremys mutica TaxID=74926 RepID=A0A9D4AUT7_9SAUR|nr:hypothetical protein KIL84_007171 [Mauremys mutica]
MAFGVEFQFRKCEGDSFLQPHLGYVLPPGHKGVALSLGCISRKLFANASISLCDHESRSSRSSVLDTPEVVIFSKSLNDQRYVFSPGIYEKNFIHENMPVINSRKLP